MEGKKIPMATSGEGGAKGLIENNKTTIEKMKHPASKILILIFYSKDFDTSKSTLKTNNHDR